MLAKSQELSTSDSLIEDNPKNPQYILNARGKGWQIRGRALNN